MSERAWIVIADRRNARFRFHGGPGEPLKAAGPGDIEFPAVAEPSDRPGRVHESAGQGRSSMEMTTNPNKLELATAGKHIAEALDKGAHDNAFDRLVIAATPELIGAIRPELSRTVEQREVIELKHRWIQLNDKELAERLTKAEVIGLVR